MGRDDQGVRLSAGRHVLVPRTLVFLTRAGKVLLIKGAPDKRIWAGKYNGLGGHVERGEDVLTAARREAEEEAGLRPEHLQLSAIVHIETGEAAGIGLFVFKGEVPDGDPIASSEGLLEWFPADGLPTTHLVEDLPTLLPRVLALPPGASPLFAHYSYDEFDRLVIRLSGL